MTGCTFWERVFAGHWSLWLRMMDSKELVALRPFNQHDAECELYVTYRIRWSEMVTLTYVAGAFPGRHTKATAMTIYVRHSSYPWPLHRFYQFDSKHHNPSVLRKIRSWSTWRKGGVAAQCSLNALWLGCCRDLRLHQRIRSSKTTSGVIQLRFKRFKSS